MVERSLYSKLDYLELLEEETAQKIEIIQRHTDEVEAFQDQEGLRMKEFKDEGKETAEEKKQRFKAFDVRLLAKITDRHTAEIKKFNQQVQQRIHLRKKNQDLEDKNKMKELMENVTDPDLTGDVENSTFVINDCTFKIQELFKFANETSEKVEKEKRRANFLKLQT